MTSDLIKRLKDQWDFNSRNGLNRGDCRVLLEAATALERGVWKPPEDWVLIPQEPTEEMVAAAVQSLHLPWREIQRMLEAYRAMIAATPTLQAKDKTDD